MVIVGGMPAVELNLDAFMAQAMEYESWDDPSDRVRRFFNEIGKTHPTRVRRVSEVMKWVQSGEYDRIIRGEYRTRDQPADVREEAGDAMEFYAERFRTIFREAGDNIATLGSQVGGMAEQLADWIRKRGGPVARASRVARVSPAAPASPPATARTTTTSRRRVVGERAVRPSRRAGGGRESRVTDRDVDALSCDPGRRESPTVSEPRPTAVAMRQPDLARDVSLCPGPSHAPRLDSRQITIYR